jgi:hypothetical protein
VAKEHQLHKSALLAVAAPTGARLRGRGLRGWFQ